MMNKNVVKALDDRAEKLISEREEAIRKNNEKFKTAKDAIETAKQKMQVAQDQEDTAEYHRAKLELNEAEDMLEMYSNVLKSYDDVPMITDEEYKTAVSQIMDAMNALKLSEEKRIIPLVKELEKIRSESRTAIDQANDVLWKYQKTLHLGTDLHYYSHGGGIMDTSLKKVYDETVIDFVDYVTTSGILTDTILPDVEHGNLKK